MAHHERENEMTKTLETLNAEFTAAIEARYAARDAFLASGTNEALAALNAAVAAQEAADRAYYEAAQAA